MAERMGGGGREQQALDAWAVNVIPRAVAYARTLLARQDDAEDVVHDVLCRLLGHREYDLMKDGQKLLFRSVTNACINKSTRRRNLVSLDGAADGNAGWADTLASAATPDPADLAIAGELRTAVGRGLAELPPMQRAALELKSMGHSLKVIAEMLEVSVSNAGVLIHRARKTLADHLGPGLLARFEGGAR